MNKNVMFAVLLAVMLCSCGSSEKLGMLDLDSPPAGTAGESHGAGRSDALLPVLPAPSSLDRMVNEVTDGQRLRMGINNLAQLPYKNFLLGNFSPSWTSPADGLGKAAYSCYRFTFQDPYEDEARIRLDWKTAPDPSGRIYIGLANHALDRWQWFEDEGEGINAGDAAVFISSNSGITCCVLVLGQQPCELSYLLLGDNTYPIMLVSTNLDLDPTKNIGPMTVAIDASKSQVYGSVISSFDFDFDGDGSWDLEGNLDGTAIHQYQPGNYVLRVRGTETTGKHSVYEKKIAIIDPSNDPPTAKLSLSTTSGLAPLEILADSFLSSDPDGYVMLYEFDIDGDSKYEIIRDTASVEDIVLAAMGTTSLKLRVTDNYYAQDEDVVDVSLLSGWKYHTVDADVKLGEASLAVVGQDAAARACVAYTDHGSDDLLYRLAQDQAAGSWGIAREPVPEGADVNLSPGLDMEINPVSGQPMISYIREDGAQDSLCTVYANDSQGLSWQSPVTIPTPAGPGGRTDLEFINTDPAIAFLMRPDSQQESKLGYVLAKNPQGSSWNSVQVLAEGISGQKAVDVALLRSDNGLFNFPLVLALMDAPQYNREILSYRAAGVDGDSWESPDFIGQAISSELAAGHAGGYPAVATGYPSANGSINFAASVDEKGQLWPGSLLEVGKGSQLGFASWGGRPCICYVSPEKDGIYLVRAADAAGSSWEAAMPVDTRSYGLEKCSMVVVNEIPVIVYGKTYEDGLFCARWKQF